MNLQLTLITLISGTCIGAGMMALPMTLAKVGIVPSLIIIVLTWFFTYYTSLINVELTLHCKDVSHSTKFLSEELSGVKARTIEEFTTKLLQYSALSAYIYGCSSIFQKLTDNNLFLIQTILAVFVITLFLFPTNIISKVNNFVFFIFILLLLFIIIRLVFCVNFSNIPFIVDINFCNIPSIIILVFTSFGYQLIFYTIRDYCKNDVNMMVKVFFYGSIIPMFVYALWAFSSVSVIYDRNIDFFNLMTTSDVDVGDFIKELSKIFSFQGLQIVFYWICVFTIFTSIIGVGLSLLEHYNSKLKNKINQPRLLSSLITVIPPYIVSTLVPNAFTKILDFAGILLIIISILIPIYLYFKANIKQSYFKTFNKCSLILCLIVSILIIFLSFIY